jgi:hypothetical protein
MPQPNEPNRRRSRRNRNRNEPARGRQLRNLELEAERYEHEIERLVQLYRMSQRDTEEAQDQIHKNIEKARREQDVVLRQLAMMRSRGVNALTQIQNVSMSELARQISHAAYPMRVVPRNLQMTPINIRTRGNNMTRRNLRNNTNQVRRRLF